MKKVRVLCLIVLALALVMLAGALTFLGPCVHEDGSAAACRGAGNMMASLGALMAAQACIALFLRKARRGLLLAIALTAALGLLVPGTVLPLCAMATMRCRMLMQPATRLLSAGIALLSLTGFAMELWAEK